MTEAVRCDLVLLSWNSLPELRACLESLLEQTDVPSRLFIVDNASTQEVQTFLRQVSPRGAIEEVRILQNADNLGFSRGMNRGLRESSAPYVCLLNNDIVVAPHWLSRLIEVAEAHQDIGVLNPSSNTFGEHIPKNESIGSFAERLEGRRGEFVELGSCIGFCFLVTRATIERVGILEEELGPFFYEDEDYCLRASAAGFRCVMVPAAYAFHHEHHSVDRLPQRDAIFQESRRRFEQRWGRALRVLYVVSRPLEPGSQALREVLERATRWARQRAFVRLFFSSEASKPSDANGRHALFQSVGLVRHADVALFGSQRRDVARRALIALLMRQKKRFDLVIADREGFARTARCLRPLHRADVILDSEDEKLEALWQQRSRVPSSF